VPPDTSDLARCAGTDTPPWLREIEHTADVGFEVDAPTLPALFERAGTALVGLMLDPSRVRPAARGPIAVAGTALDELLHDWLHAILVRVQSDGFAVGAVEVADVGAGGVRGTLVGEPIDRARHVFHGEVKGVTWHQLAVRETATGWTARVIFDV
jgi:SHS2 domain-containing protein